MVRERAQAQRYAVALQLECDAKALGQTGPGRLSPETASSTLPPYTCPLTHVCFALSTGLRLAIATGTSGLPVKILFWNGSKRIHCTRCGHGGRGWRPTGLLCSTRGRGICYSRRDQGMELIYTMDCVADMYNI